MENTTTDAMPSEVIETEEVGVGEVDSQDAVESAHEPTLDEILAASFDESDSDDSEATDEVTEPPTQTYTVKVDGEEIEVTLDEMLNGYQRTADYTRKTQALASERERFTAYEQLDQLLQSDAKSAIELLAQQFGVQLTDTPQVPDPLSAVPEELQDPLERQVAQLEQRLAAREAAEAARAEQAEQAARIAAIDSEIDSVRTQFNVPDLDERQLLTFATEHRIGDLAMAYRSMKALEAEAQAQAETTRILQTKRTLPPVEGGSSRNTAALTTGGSRRLSLLEAVDAAWDEHS